MTALGPAVLPTSTWADGITRIEPIPACPNETLTLHGTFSATQPANVVVMIGWIVVPVVSWSATQIVVQLPPEHLNGACVGFRNEELEASLQAEVARRRAVIREMAEALRCLGHAISDEEAEIPWQPSTPPCTPFNFFPGSKVQIEYFRINGMEDPLVVEPGMALTITWSVSNAFQSLMAGPHAIRIQRIGGDGPPCSHAESPASGASVGSINLGPFDATQRIDAKYQITARNRCHKETRTIRVLVRRLPKLKIEKIEVTQGIQGTWAGSQDPNSINLVAGKDTIVRVYVSADVGGFMANEVPITGQLTMFSGTPGEVKIKPANEGLVSARPAIAINRALQDNTLNFRIPAAWANGAQWLLVNVWGSPVERPPYGAKVKPTATSSRMQGWLAIPALKVRFVRVRDVRPGGMAELSLDPARELVLRAFDLLPFPPTDIQEADIGVWSTGLDVTTTDGQSDLVHQLHDQHNCSLTEWLGLGEDSCPDDDDAKWIGVLPYPNVGGIALKKGWPTYTQNTCVASDRFSAAHELGHLLGFAHVNVTNGCRPTPEGPYDTLIVDGGRVDPVDTFDPDPALDIAGTAVGTVPDGESGMFDIMSYACTQWISKHTWLRMIF